MTTIIFFFIFSIIIIGGLLLFHYYKLKTTIHYSDDEYEIINGARENIDYMDGVDVIYWINLDRSTDRRIEMARIFQDSVFQNMKIERIPAVDGKKPETVYPRLQFMYKQKNDYEYACMLSHLETIRRFSQTNYEVALIMEDDLTLELKPYWRKSIQEVIDGAPKDWEIIQLCYIINGSNTNPRSFQIYEHNTRNKCVSAAAYLVRNSTAKKLINDIYNDGKYNLEHYIVHHADCYLFSKCVTYTYKYPFFIYKTNNDSLLHPEDLKDHERSKRKVLEMYKKYRI
jgi:GR25 family glycosyltransferase involved in LPS biosynthesis